MIFFAYAVYIYKQLVNHLMIRRDKMQQRFCSVCGFPIWVQYQISSSNSKTIFWSRDDILAEDIKRCPCCWKQFDINTLS